jgi:hypothetical protein
LCELKQKQLARADGGDTWEVKMEIRLYRERPSEAKPGKPLVAKLWDYLTQKSLVANKSKTVRSQR